MDYRDLTGSGFVDGTSTERVATNTYRISAPGRSFSSPAELHDHMMLKAARTAQAVGATHFAVVVWGGEGASRSGGPMGGRGAADTYIRVFTLAPGLAPPTGSVAVDSILKQMDDDVRSG